MPVTTAPRAGRELGEVAGAAADVEPALTRRGLQRLDEGDMHVAQRLRDVFELPLDQTWA